MPSPLLAILLLLGGLTCSLFLLVLLAAGSANSQPHDYAVMKTLMLSLLICAAIGVIGTIAGLILRQPAVAVIASVVPLEVSVLALLAFIELSHVQVERGDTPSGGKLIIRAIVFLVFGVGGLVMFYVGARERELQRRLLVDAQPVAARIVESAVTSSEAKEKDETSTHRPDVRFRYALGGVEYESDLLRPSAIARTYASRDSAAAELAPFPRDATVTAYVSPAMPAKAYLVRDWSAGPIVFLIVGALLGPIALLAGRLI